MEDNLIIEKLFRRSEDAIADVSEKYEANCMKIAERIVNNKEDAEECVNDTFLAVWNNIPPERPNPLSAYIYRITRNVAIKNFMPIWQKRETIIMIWYWMNCRNVLKEERTWKVKYWRRN